MIGYLEGVVRHGTVVTAGGVGYQVLSSTPLVEGSAVELHVHTHMRDSAITLYGFAQPADRDLFLALTKIPGVGGTHALALLRDVGAAALIDAVRTTDPGRLTAAAGVGPKLAQKVVSLIALPAHLPEIVPTAPGRGGGGVVVELTDALVGLGYPASVSSAAAEDVAASQPDATTEQLLGVALARM